jgi:hypothetical protein
VNSLVLQELARDAAGKVIVNDRPRLWRILKAVHAHERYECLLKRVKEVVSDESFGTDTSSTTLAREVEMFSASCPACKQAKRQSTLASVVRRKRHRLRGPRLKRAASSLRSPHQNVPPGRWPFEVVHVDCSTFWWNPGSAVRVEVVTLECAYSRFVLTRILDRAAHSDDVARLFDDVLENYYTVPRVVVTDNGTEFKAEFKDLVSRYGIRHISVNPYRHTENGLVERVQQTIQDRVRAFRLEKQGFWNRKDFTDSIKAAIRGYNTTWHRATKIVPSTAIFTYPSWTYPDISECRPEGTEKLFPVLEQFRQHSEREGPEPKEGEQWYIANRKSMLATMDPRRVVAVLGKYDSERDSWEAIVGTRKTRVSRMELHERLVERPDFAMAVDPMSDRPGMTGESGVAEVPGGPEAMVSSPIRRRSPRPERRTKRLAIEKLRKVR